MDFWVSLEVRILNSKYCRKLGSIQPLMLSSLEKLDRSFCASLESFPPVVDGVLGKLKMLYANHCCKLRHFPPIKFPSLEQLDLSYRVSLESFPPIVDGLLDKLQILRVNNCSMLKTIPPLKLTMLQHLDLSSCDSFESFLEILGEMENITKIHLKCNLSNESFAVGFQWFANVKELYLSWSKFIVLPACIKKCNFLWKLILDNCEELEEIEGIPASLTTLSDVNCLSLTGTA